MSRTICLLLPLFLMASLSAISIAAEEWNVTVGGDPARYGRCSALGPDDATILWQGGAGAVISWQAAIDGDIAVMARCFDIQDTLHGTLVYAYDIHTGAELWTVDLPVDFPATDWRNHLSGVRDGVVYASRAGNTNASYMYALDLTDGSQIWKSEDLVDECSTEGVSFAPDGDLIVGNFGSVMRMESADGSTVWETPRSSPTSNGSMMAVFDRKAYGWASGGSGPTIEVFDLDTGQYLYESDPLYGGYIQQTAPFVGPDGTVYAPRCQNNPGTDYLVALEDTGSGLGFKWEVPLGFVTFSSFAVGPDGSVYSYNRSGQVIRIDPDSGTVLNTSVDVEAGLSTYMAADGVGRLFVASEDELYAFSTDLSLLWSETVSNIDGPSIAGDGTLIVTGSGSEVRAYEGCGTGIAGERGSDLQSGVRMTMLENPVHAYGSAGVVCELAGPATAVLRVYDASGRLVREVDAGELAGGGQTIGFDVSGIPAGIYLVELSLDGAAAGSTRMVVLD